MGASASSRARVLLTALFTIWLVLGEFALVMAVYHLDDHVTTHQTATARLRGSLSGWQPGDPARPVLDAVHTLVVTDTPGSARLEQAAQVWAATQRPQDLTTLRGAQERSADLVAAERRHVDRDAQLLLGTLLLVVSVGWFWWFRRLVRRQRELQRAVTEKQVLDAGERRLLALVQNSADLVLVLEPDSTSSFVSPSARSVLGVAPADLVGRPFVDLLLPKDVPTFVRLMASSREGDQAALLQVRHADGRELTLEGTLTNLMAEQAVHGWVLTVRDVTDRELLQDELTHRAFHDTLTGLPNRQLFADRLAHALRRRDGASRPLAVLLLDLDDFKHVNDSLGHGIGDDLLLTVAERLTATVREGDTVARLGGDEFAVLMEDADLETAGEVATRLLATLAEPVLVDGSPHPVRASVGISEAVPGEIDAEQTLRNADVAMYWAKDRGKGTVAVYEAGLHAQALAKMALRGELQRAIREDQLVLHYQPTVDLSTSRITGFEALVRWNHPTRGLLPPAEFITVAEECGLIVPLGSWVLRAACAAGATLQSDRQQPTMAVNIAAQQLAREDFVDEVVEVLQGSRMPADRLVLEITEGVLLDDMAGVVASLSRLRAHGVRVAIDDFGTGYSSLSYLAQLPVDILKVDKSFVDSAAGPGAADTSLLEAIIAMSRGMQLTTVAEGVEQPEQAAWLQLAQCTLGQGYLWSRPVELSAARRLLNHGLGRPREHGPARGTGDEVLVRP